ncbi:MAG: hypothetical protein AEth_00868 [Candidatus Argoarchaeum ethanivorans]|uniref:Uncharacterized protein n=1 Tax=Candidatus Argoarchaeum ethanivorans TaxID=2608793 RepID=A0A8B3S2G0_9EURY|nr:MAG: hypothetical protein AEth_00868 [Candidatus Argoarchaeum ethanivorans]
MNKKIIILLVAAVIQIIVVSLIYTTYITPQVEQLSYWEFGRTEERNDWLSYVKFEAKSAFVAGEPIKVKINFEILNSDMFEMYKNSNVTYFFENAYDFPIIKYPKPKPAKYPKEIHEKSLSFEEEITYLMPGEYKYYISIPGSYNYFFCHGNITDKPTEPRYVDKVVDIFKTCKTEECKREKPPVDGESIGAVFHNQSTEFPPQNVHQSMEGFFILSKPSKLPENCEGTLYPVSLEGRPQMYFESEDVFHIAPLETRLNVLNNKVTFWLTIIVLIIAETQLYFQLRKKKPSEK